jgi:hypothetical protein
LHQLHGYEVPTLHQLHDWSAKAASTVDKAHGSAFFIHIFAMCEICSSFAQGKHTGAMLIAQWLRVTIECMCTVQMMCKDKYKSHACGLQYTCLNSVISFK